MVTLQSVLLAIAIIILIDQFITLLKFKIQLKTLNAATGALLKMIETNSKIENVEVKENQ